MGMTRTINEQDAFQLLRRVNLNHLLYFWAVGQAGSITAASERLGVAQPGVTMQLQTLERRLGAQLVERGPRGVSLTPAGQVAMRYAEEVVGICSELVRALPLKGSIEERPFVIGTVDSVPKIVVRSILKNITALEHPPRLVCREWRMDQLMSELSLHRLDVVITDVPLTTDGGSGLRCTTAATSAIDLYASPSLARRYRRGFPESVREAPFVLPSAVTTLRSSIDRWFALPGIQPRIAIESDDRALLHHFAEAGLGVVPVAAITAREVARQFTLERIGSLANVHEEYYVVMMARKNEHSAVSTLMRTLAVPGARRKSRG